jgi:antilisterial bacteriocin subtilosin biosynthesis protein AlbA
LKDKTMSVTRQVTQGVDIDDFYPSPSDNYEFHTTAEGSHLYFSVRGNGPNSALGMKELNSWVVPLFTARYLKRCDGFTKHKDIVQQVYADLPPVLREIQARRAIETLNRETGVLSFEENPRASKMLNTGDFNSFSPLHTSIEITDQCNFVCDHCYVSASPWKLGMRDGKDLIDLLVSLRGSGVKVIELTGGECTIHPNFREVLAKAAELFHLVAVVSNGWKIGRSDELSEYISSLENVIVQISIDGTEEYHDSFRSKKGSFAAACDAVRKLRVRGTVVRVAMTVTQANIQHVEPIIHLAKSLDASALSLSPVTAFGRAEDTQIAGNCPQSDHELMHAIHDITAPYADDPIFATNRLALEVQDKHSEINCGAGWRSFALNGATGEVRSCLFLADSKKFGSVDQQDYSEIFSSPHMKMFKNAPSPSSELETCRDCQYLATCTGCFAKAFKVCEENFEDKMCPWRQRYFPGMELSME